MENSKPVQPERRPLLIVRLWRSLPVILRAIIVGELVVSIGGVPPELAIVANLRTSPHLPWLLVVTAIWLWLFWPSFNFPARPRRFSSYPDSLRFGRLIFGDARVDNRF
jgi:hypothetical protein